MRTALASLAVAIVAAAASPAAGAAPGRIAVGVSPDAAREDVGAAVAAATGGAVAEDLGPLRALVLEVPDVEAAVTAAASVAGVAYAEAVVATRSLAFIPNDRLADSQWYLSAINAFDHWRARPPLAPVLVAVVDSGIDAGHPEFAGRIARTQTFVSTKATVDSFGHGTIVAGEIAAALNDEGIAGVGISAKLLVAKVVPQTGEISVLAEAKAIRWAVANGADVVNLSLGGPRNPKDPTRDTYSALEHAAIDYATKRGVVVVAATGNCVGFVCPERYADYPAALPHVIGVSALEQDGSTPDFSNRDHFYNDVGAPGIDILSTYPRSLARSGCPYTECANAFDRRHPEGTSFSAPLVTAAAALLAGERGMLGLRPLHASQVTAVLERTAADVGPAGRDPRSGNGRLDVNAALDALAGTLPLRDRYETNDDAGARAYTLWGRSRRVAATLDRFEDERDVYRVRLRAGQRGVFRLAGPAGANSNLNLWRPRTARVSGSGRRLADRLRASAGPGSVERIAYRARRAGWYFVEVRLAAGRGGAYRLTVTKGR